MIFGVARRMAGMQARQSEAEVLADQSRAEIASVLEINERTVRRHCAYAKAWLHRRLEGGDD